MKAAAAAVWQTQDDPDLRWNHFTPGTNVAWIRYLFELLPQKMDKSHKQWRKLMSKEEKQSLSEFR